MALLTLHLSVDSLLLLLMQMENLHRFDPLRRLQKLSSSYLVRKHLFQHVAAFLTASDILQTDLHMVPVTQGRELCLFH